MYLRNSFGFFPISLSIVALLSAQGNAEVANFTLGSHYFKDGDLFEPRAISPRFQILFFQRFLDRTGETLPAYFTCRGPNESPGLWWYDEPPNTQVSNYLYLMIYVHFYFSFSSISFALVEKCRIQSCQ
jgi:hypothetical protein